MDADDDDVINMNTATADDDTNAEIFQWTEWRQSYEAHTHAQCIGVTNVPQTKPLPLPLPLPLSC